MKILVITHTTDLSGANKSLLSIIEQLCNIIEFVVVVNDKNGLLVERLKQLNVKIIHKKYSWIFAKPRMKIYKKIIRFTLDCSRYYLYRRINYKTLKEISEYNFDMIYTNTSTVDLGAILSDKLNIPHIWHIREFGEEDFGFSPLVNKKYRKRILNEASSIILISKALKNKYSKYVIDDKLRVVYNGFDIEKLYCPIRKNHFNNEINLLIAGQVCEAKGQHQAIAAVGKLRDKGYNVNLYIAGGVDEEYLNKSISKYKCKEWIKVLGSVGDMYKLRDKMDIELVCSRNEAFGRVTLEAMLHGIPVIGSNVGGTVELISNGSTGLLYELGNINDLVEKIEILIKDEKLYVAISQNALEFARKFTIEKTAVRVLEIFNETKCNK